MDWIDPRYATGTKDAPVSRSRKASRQAKRGKPLSVQVSAALAQPIDVWGVAFDHALSKLKWPDGCSAEATLFWSTVIQEQAEVLVWAGMSAKKLSTIVAETTPITNEERVEQLAEVVGLMDQSLESLAFQ